MKMDYQVIVIGAGPGGYVAAIRAAQKGLKTLLIEKEKVGGVCLNHGCIPTKTLVKSAEVYRQTKKAGEYGIIVDGVKPDWERVINRKDLVVKQLVKGIEFLLKKNKVNTKKGVATIKAPHTVLIRTDDGAEEIVTGENVILATGSEPLVFPEFCHNGRNVITSEEALSMTMLPARVLIIGGGVIGCEFASIYSVMGVEVTIVELMPRLLPLLEEELSKGITKSLKSLGVKILTETKVREVKADNSLVTTILEDGQTLSSDLVLLSLGRRPYISGLGLEELGVVLTKQNRVKVDDYLCSNLPWLYAIGDVNDAPYDLAHAASAQGILVAENIAGSNRKIEYRAVPSCVFTMPEMASVGMSVLEAENKGYKVRIGRFPMLASGKAVSMGETEGFVMLVSNEESGEILGAHMMGPHVTDIIAETTLAINKRMTIEDLCRTIHAHPTIAETVMEAAEATLKQAIHI